ncbi:ABC transporter G family member 20-like isoform X2 [Copidosoma floridanum]|nr:ABC transporter G family member 20-like isoform X2 [Copidosoma floridanum]
MQNAVVVKLAHKRYAKNLPPVLDGLNMTVPRGCIYGLLGASGCGKTTLLSCVVGVRTLDSGELWVLGGKPGQKDSGVPGPRVGYMPQEISLVKEFSVIGALYYFGRINGLDEEVIDERFEFFSELLELPFKDKLVKDISGGQQRRVSLAAALMHRPELLILDEPTVGLDPILREKIWNYLVKVAQEEDIAVIVTTHYIEEAKKAHIIGLMRHGQLLAETSPTALLAAYQCASLEEAFLILSKRQNNAKTSVNETRIAQTATANQAALSSRKDPRGSTEFVTGSEKQLLDNPKRIKKRSANPFTAASGKIFKALLIKNILQFVRHPSVVAFAFIFPLIQVTLFFYTVGNDPRGIVINVVNDEAGNCRDGTYTGTVLYSKEQRQCEYIDMSCRFLHGFDQKIIVKKYHDSMAEATDEVYRGKAAGTMYFAKNFSKALMMRRESFYTIKKLEGSLSASEIQTTLDMSNQPIGIFLQTALFDRFVEVYKEIVATCDLPRKFVQPPINFEEPIYGAMDRKYSNFIAPGFILTITFFLATAVSSSIIIADKAEGVWDRSLVQGVTTWEILASHLFTQLLMVFIQVSVVLGITFGHFNLPCEGQFIVIVVLVFVTGVCGLCYGFLISVYCTSQTVANFIATGSFYPIILLSGAIWPLEGMSNYLRWVSYLMPTTVATYSLRCVMDKGYAFTHFDVYSGFIVIMSWTVGTIVASFIGIRKIMT